MRLDSRLLNESIEIARGLRPADLCLRGCRLVNVLTGRIEEVDIAVHNGMILGWGKYEAVQNLDLDGMYVCPGFIDAHIHIESTLLDPARFSDAVVPWGTTTVIADPHEIANVLGIQGLRYMLHAVEDLAVDIYFNLPSCVPATPLETSGAQLRAADLFSLVPHPKILGLAEMMNFPGVLYGSPDVTDKLILFQEARIDGHAPRLGGLDLNAYIAAGISSDHECTGLEEAREKLSKGMALMIREGSQSKDLAALLPAVNEHTWPHCMFVGDDRHPDDLLREGHMNVIVNRAMELGMEPVRALTLATLTAANHFRLPRTGAVAPGYRADFSVSPTLHPWVPVRVFKQGLPVARDGKLLAQRKTAVRPRPPESPMKLGGLTEEDLAVPAGRGALRIIGVREGSLLTDHLLLPPKIEGGRVVPDVSRDILKIVVFNRYVGERPPAIAFVKGIGLRKGAIATSVAHDSHNVIAVGTTDSSILRAVDAVRKAGGAMAICADDGPGDLLPLPIGGLMTDAPLEDVVEKLDTLNACARDWGCPLHNPFMALSFMALPVIPELKITDLGLVDVAAFSFIPLFDGE